MRAPRVVGAVALVLGLLVLVVGVVRWKTSRRESAEPNGGSGTFGGGTVITVPPVSHDGIDKIQHVVMIMQENRSFDSYFGTYPGADGIPMADGQPTVCSPNPATGSCDAPYHVVGDLNTGGPHSEFDAGRDIDGGKMDGFVAQAEKASQVCVNINSPDCARVGAKDVMGWRDARDIPNYWSYAQNFVLHDHMFEPTTSWSLPSHLFMTSEWSASCDQADVAESCVNNNSYPPLPPDARTIGKAPTGTTVPIKPSYAWTDLTYLLHQQSVSWGYYVAKGSEPDCEDDAATCSPKAQSARTPGIWNPLPWFTTVNQDGQLGNIQDTSAFLTQARDGTLPAVSWVVPDQKDSEHPPATPAEGQAYVTNLVNTIMQGPDWGSTAIFISWDDWGGLLRPRAAAEGRPERLRPAGAQPADQPVCPAGDHRPPDPQLRRLREVHRGPVPGRLAPRPGHRRPARPSARRAGGRRRARRPGGRLRLRSTAPAPDGAARAAAARAGFAVTGRAAGLRRRPPARRAARA